MKNVIFLFIYSWKIPKYRCFPTHNDCWRQRVAWSVTAEAITCIAHKVVEIYGPHPVRYSETDLYFILFQLFMPHRSGEKCYENFRYTRFMHPLSTFQPSRPHSSWERCDKNILMFENWRERKMKQVAQRATIAHLSPMCQGQISFQKIQTHPSFNACSCYMKVSKGSNQKQQRKSGNTIFPIIRSIGIFLRRSRATNSVVGGPIWPKFELIHNIMHVLVTSKFENDRININRDYVMTSIF